METEYIIVFITAPSRDVGEQIARALLDDRLVACVNLVSTIDSLFWWQDEIQSEQEILLIAKSRADLFENGILRVVLSIHPYDVPEVIALPIVKGSREYLDWIDEETTDIK